MKSANERIALAALVLLPLLANILPLLGIVNSDPQVLYSGIGSIVKPGFLPGLPYIDPSGGFIYQPLATESLRQWLSGSMPWWNHFEGIGVPLAGGITAGTFSPYLFLLLLPKGLLLQQLVAQISCGLLTFAVLRLVKCNVYVAFVGAALFELNGTFAWLGYLWCHPIVSLPLCVVGLELIRKPSRRASLLGAICIAFAVYIAIVGSFIEIGYLDLLLAFGWFLVRLSQCAALRDAGRYSICCVVGAALGLMLASPALAAIADSAKYGTSVHHTAGIGYNSLTGAAVPQFIMPYIWGPIFHFSSIDVGSVWGSVGGYIGLAPVIIGLAIFSLKRERRLAAMLGVWTILTVGAQFGVPLAVRLINLIPGIPFTAQYRYSASSWEFAVAILCGLILSEWRIDKSPFLGSAHRIALSGLGVALVWAVIKDQDILQHLLAQEHYKLWLLASAAIVLIVSCVVFILMVRGGRTAFMLIGAILVAEAFVYYAIPTLSYPRQGVVDTKLVSFLQSRIGFSRLYSINGLAPNYGSYFRIPMVNHNDPLIPREWTDYAVANLDPYSAMPLLFLQYRMTAKAPLSETLSWELANFQDVGVKYVTATPGEMSNAYAPPLGGSQTAFPLGRTRIAGSISGLAEDQIDRVGVMIGTNSGMANGRLGLRVCSGNVCRHGEISMFDVPDNDFATIKLSGTLPVKDSKISFLIFQENSTRDAAVWLFARTSVNETMGAGYAGFFPNLRIYSKLATFLSQTVNADNKAFSLGSNRLKINLAAPGAAQAVHSVGIFQGTSGTADGLLHVKLCSGGGCSEGVSSIKGSADDDYLQVAVTRPVMVSSHRISVEVWQSQFHKPDAVWLYPEEAAFPQVLTLGGKTMAGLAAKLRFSATYTVLPEVFHDALGSVYQVPGTKPYFSAPGCSLQVIGRDDVDADCGANTSLVRRELMYPGWSVWINDRKSNLEPQGILQKVALSKGRSRVRFYFEPAHVQIAFVLWGIGMLAVFVGVIALLRMQMPLSLRRAIPKG